MNFLQLSCWTAALKDSTIGSKYHPLNTVNDVITMNIQLKKSYESVKTEHKNTNTMIGYLCISIWLILWMAISEIMPMISTNYNQPFFMRYCIGSTYSLILLIWYILNQFKMPKITWNMLWSAFIMNIVDNLSSYLWYISLTATITAINNTIYESQLIYTYILSIIFLSNYNISMLKNMCVIICILGVIIIGIGSLNDHEHDKLHNTTMGMIQVSLSSFGFAVLEIMIKLFGDKYYKTNNSSQFEQIKDVLLMQGIIGLFCLFTLWPGIYMMDYMDLESFKLPSTKQEILNLIIVCILNLFWSTSFIVGISLTNPVLMTMSGLLIIPITFLFDVIFYSLDINFLTVIGTLLIAIGFILMESPIIDIIKSIMFI